MPIVWVSNGFERMTGYFSNSATSIVGVNCRELQTDASDPSTISAMREAIDEARSIRVCVWNAGKDGVGFWNCLSMYPFFGDDGNCRYFVASQVRLTNGNHKKLIKIARRSVAEPGFGTQRYSIRASPSARRSTLRSSNISSSEEASSFKDGGAALPDVAATPTTADRMHESGAMQTPSSKSSHKSKSSVGDSPQSSASSTKSSTCAIL